MPTVTVAVAVGMATIRPREDLGKVRLGRTTRARGGLIGAVPACMQLAISNGGNRRRRPPKIGGYAMTMRRRIAWWGEYGRKEMTPLEGAGWQRSSRWRQLNTAPTRAGMGQLGGSGEEQGLARGDGQWPLVGMTRGGRRQGHLPVVALSPAVRVHQQNQGGGWDNGGEGVVRAEEDGDESGMVVGEEGNVGHSGGGGDGKRQPKGEGGWQRKRRAQEGKNRGCAGENEEEG